MPSVSSTPLLGQTWRRGAHELRQHFTLNVGTPTAGTVPPGAFVLGVDQAQVEVTGAMVRDMLDLPRGPRGAGSGERLVERAFDLLVDAADGEDGRGGPLFPRLRPRPPPRPGPEIRVGRLRRSLGIEELTGAAGHRRHPTDALSGHRHGPGGGTIDGDGESARWPRHGSLSGSVSRKVGDSTEQGAG